MGKKVIKSQSSVLQKTPKINDHKKQLNSLIKVLRPKVYITDSSTFKSLVQELTGNGSTPNPITMISTPSQVLFDDHDDDLFYQDISDHSADLSFDSSERLSVPTPFSTAPESESSPEQCMPAAAPESSSFMTHEMNFPQYYRNIESSPQEEYILASLTACDESSFFITHNIDFSQHRDIPSSPLEPCIQPPPPLTAYQSSFMTHEMDFSVYREVESWLLENTDPLPYYDSYAPLIQQEICVYDYAFSGLM